MRKLEEDKSERIGLGLREMVEVALGLGSVTALSWLIPVEWRSSHVLFCAFFLVIFAVAVRYTKSVTYVTSALAALSYWLLLWSNLAMQAQLHFLYLAFEPLLLLLSGICASDILDWQQQRLKTLEQKYATVDITLQQSAERYQMALTINSAMERQIAEQPTSVATMSDKMARLGKVAGEERCRAIVDLMLYALEAQSCALYMRNGDTWLLSAERSDEGAGHAAVLNRDDHLIKRVIERREVSTIRDVLAVEASASYGTAVMVGPVLDQAGELVGIVLIDKMPLLKFTPGTVRLFSSLLQIISVTSQKM